MWPGQRELDVRPALRVVIAEDHADLRHLLKLNLELAGGFEVVGDTDDGVEAVDLVDALHPDALLVDLQLPGCNGFQVIDEVSRRSPGVAVVVLSGRWTPCDEQRALAAGAFRYLFKGPSVLTEVVETLRASSPRRRVGADVE